MCVDSFHFFEHLAKESGLNIVIFPLLDFKLRYIFFFVKHSSLFLCCMFQELCYTRFKMLVFIYTLWSSCPYHSTAVGKCKKGWLPTEAYDVHSE